MYQYGTTSSNVSGWSHTFICLDTVGHTTIPTTAVQKDLLVGAGLGEKKIHLTNIDCAAELFQEILYNHFPRLCAGGGYQLFKCTPNSTELGDPLLSLSLRSPCDLQMFGSSRTYIVPLQKSLDTTRDSSLAECVSHV